MIPHQIANFASLVYVLTSFLWHLQETKCLRQRWWFLHSLTLSICNVLAMQ